MSKTGKFWRDKEGLLWKETENGLTLYERE